jgi:hypothetical protein
LLAAFGEQVHVGVIDSGPLPTITAPPGGTNSLVSVSVPGLLQTGVLTVTSNATTGPSGSVSSTANATNVTIGSALLTVSALASQCHIDSTGHQTGAATVGTVTVRGNPVTVTSAPNTTLSIPGVGTTTFNEQITTTNSITVNAVHVHLTGTLGNGRHRPVDVLGHCQRRPGPVRCIRRRPAGWSRRLGVWWLSTDQQPPAASDSKIGQTTGPKPVVPNP